MDLSKAHRRLLFCRSRRENTAGKSRSTLFCAVLLRRCQSTIPSLLPKGRRQEKGDGGSDRENGPPSICGDSGGSSGEKPVECSCGKRGIWVLSVVIVINRTLVICSFVRLFAYCFVGLLVGLYILFVFVCLFVVGCSFIFILHCIDVVSVRLMKKALIEIHRCKLGPFFCCCCCCSIAFYSAFLLTPFVFGVAYLRRRISVWRVWHREDIWLWTGRYLFSIGWTDENSLATILLPGTQFVPHSSLER